MAQVRAGAPPGAQKAERPTLQGQALEKICRANSITKNDSTSWIAARARWCSFLDNFRPQRLVRRWWGVPA